MTALRFLQITDTHLVGDADGRQRGVITLDSFRAVLRTALTPEVDVVLLTGDVVHDDPDGYAWIKRELAACGRPVLCIPGNHDDAQLLREALAGEPFRHGGHHDFGAWRVIMLDSLLPGAVEGRLAAGELQRLDAALAGAAVRHVLVVLHHHPVALGSRWLDAIGLVNATEFFATIDRHATVRGILWGHVHQAFETRRRSPHGELQLMATPSTCVQFRPGASDFELDVLPPGFRRLTLHEDGRIDTAVGWLS